MADQPSTTTAPSSGGTTTTTSTGQAQTPAGEGGSPGMQMIFTLVPMFLIFYLLIIRPENKRRKEKESLLGGVKPKDKVVTIGGLHGTVVEIDGDDVVLLVDSKKDVKMKFRRSAIDSIQTPPTEEKK